MPPQQQQDQRDLAPWEMTQPPAEQPPPPRDVPPWELAQPSLGTRAIGDYQPLPGPDITTPQGAGAFLTGIGKGGLQLAHGTDVIARGAISKVSPKTAEFLLPQVGIGAMQQLATPRSATEEVGKETGEALPQLAFPAGGGLLGAGLRIAGTGALSAMQSSQPTWGDFATGAAVGALGEVIPGAMSLIGKGPRKFSTGAFESSIGIGPRNRVPGYQAGEIGQIGLNELPKDALTPQQIRDASIVRLNQLSQDKANMLAAATRQGKTGSTLPLHQILNDALAKVPPMSEQRAADLEALRLKLGLEHPQPAVPGTPPQPTGLVNAQGQPIMTAGTPGTPAVQPRTTLNPQELNQVKQQISDEIQKWGPTQQRDINTTEKQLYGAIDRQLDQMVPGHDAVNQKLSGLTRIKERAMMTMGQGGFVQSAMHRGTVHTGAMAGAILGAEKAGTPGGIAAYLTQETLARPEVKMWLARRLAPVAPLTAPIGWSGSRYVIPRLLTGFGRAYLGNQNQ